MLRSIAVVLFPILCSLDASAQTAFAAALDGNQQVPQLASPNSGQGSFTLDPFTGILSYDVTLNVVSGTFLVATLEQGALGSNGPILATLSGSSPHYVGSTSLSPTAITALTSNGVYVNVRSVGAPNGELRGQVVPVKNQFAVVCSAANEVPPVASAGTASGTITLDASNRIVYDIQFTNLVGPYQVSHIHAGPPTTNGGIVFILQQPTPGHVVGTTTPISGKQIANLRSSLFYINIHSLTFQTGELRGQIVPSFLEYGAGCPHAGGTAKLSGTGVPTPGGAIAVDIDNGAPSSFGVLFVSVAAYGGTLGYGCPLLVHPALMIPIALGLGPSGSLSLPAILPATTPLGTAIDLQYLGDGGSGVPFATNGLQMMISG